MRPRNHKWTPRGGVREEAGGPDRLLGEAQQALGPVSSLRLGVRDGRGCCTRTATTSLRQLINGK